MNMIATQKLYTCKINNRWMWSIESACLTIQSPTGGSITLYKWHIGDASDELQKLVWRISSADKTIDLTREEMQLLLTYPKLSKSMPYKPKAKSLAQRKYDWRKKNKDNGRCGCGGNIIEKDHGKWIGWYCPKCQSGGSKNK
jgi:hypothetical protein